MASLYKDLVRARIPTDHHESDLYVLDTPEARETINKYGYKFTTFMSNLDGKRWIDVPFAYEPFWEKKQQAARGARGGERTVEAATGLNVPYEWPKKARKGAPKKRSHATKMAHATRKSATKTTTKPAKTRSEATIKVHEDQILSGKSLLFRSYDAALNASRRVTTNPGVTEFWSASSDGQWYAADGDHWIGRDNERGQYLYGKGGRLLNVIEVER